ncbi:MAG: tRNA (N6-isopentenyl adenosine(37)-C2)-methylthiotransferase MiaB [Desulfovibrio sp.]|nr:tRNA (N6-isopentenyl adenosine(37)-C2)-methylthiotransferase MiaB [Desulfovibrio sp.]
MPFTFHILTFGCQMNVNDSLWLAGVLSARGGKEADVGTADVICLNTCSVREKPEIRVKNMLSQICGSRKANPPLLIAVLGCVAKQHGEDLLSFPNVRLVAAADHLFELPDVIEKILQNPDQRVALLDFTEDFVEREEGIPLFSAPTAYVNIMQGCDNFCTYCIVPYTRGRQRSREAGAVLSECRQKIGYGAKELVLLGQNVNAFGLDACRGHKTQRPSFARLCQEVAALPGLQRLRYTSPHPKDMTEEDIAAFSTLPALCPSLHLPMQAGSDRILRRMGRGYTRKDFLLLVERLKNARPDIALSTDIIVGFPGETEEDLNETLSLMEACGFVSSYSFCYSDRPEARASTFPDKISQETKVKRLEAVQSLQEELSRKWLASRCQTETDILLEGPSKRDAEGRKSWQGRDPYNCLVHVHLPEDAGKRGESVPVRIREAGKHCLFADPLP